LQTLQHAILNHDETLSFGEVEHRLAIPTRIDSRSAPSMLLDPPRAVVITAPVERRDGAPEPVVVDVSTQEQVSPTQLPAQRKHVAVLMVRTDFDTADDANRSAIDNMLDEVTDTIREGVECFGGTIAASIGSVTMALFDMPRQMGNSAERAVRAALAVRDCLNAALETVEGVRVIEHAVVTTGEALVRYQATESGAPVTITGALVEQGQSALVGVAPGETWISNDVRLALEHIVVCHPVSDTSQLWQVDRVRQEHIPHHALPVVDREPELELLRGLMDRTRHRRTPHLVTVLGDAGVGKTRFLGEFQRRVVGHPTTGQFIVAHASWPDEDGVRAIQTEILAACCGIQRTDTVPVAQDKVRETATKNLGTARAEPLLPALFTLVNPDADGQVDLSVAWRTLIAAVADHRSMVLVIDDLHLADDRLLDFVEELTEAVDSVPLLTIIAARSDLVRRRPDWSGGHRQATTFTLDPLSDAAIDRLLELLLSKTDAADPDVDEMPLIASRDLKARREYIRMLLCLDRGMPTDSATHIRSNPLPSTVG
ncbi:MAG: AAA family ATPase, partial [Actinomycetota bacterium]|nr:AAA family ATPase [Actinomycetota bacterium]